MVDEIKKQKTPLAGLIGNIYNSYYFIFRELSFWGLILGLFLLLVLRISYVTVNPIWSDVTSNSAVLLIAVIATLNKIYTGYIISVSQSGPRANCLSTKLQDSKVSGSGWFLVALGFGALMFLTHDVFGEVSLICRWAVSGYPHTGPKPNPWGYVHVMYFLLSVVSLLNYLCGSAAACVLDYYQSEPHHINL